MNVTSSGIISVARQSTKSVRLKGKRQEGEGVGGQDRGDQLARPR